MTEYEKAVEICDTYMRAMSANDYDVVLALYADDATLEDPVGSDVLSGKAAISEFYRSIGDTDITCERTGSVRYAGREIVFPFDCTMQTKDGKLKVEIIDHFILNDDDLVVGMRAFWGMETTSIVG